MKRKVLSVLLCVCFLPCFFVLGCKKEKNAGCRYEIKAEYVEENALLRGTQKVVYENREEEMLERLVFLLYANAYQKGNEAVEDGDKNAAYYQGESYGDIQITSVNGCKGWEIAGEEENILNVYLLTPLYPGEKVTVDIAFITSLAHVNHRLGVGERTVNLSYFYPQLCVYENGFVECLFSGIGEPFLSDCADYSVKINLPKEYAVAASGTLVKENVLENNRICEFQGENIRAFSLVLGKDLLLKEFFVGKTLVKGYYFKGEEPFFQEEDVQKMLAFYGARFGEYPYPTLSLVSASTVLAGQGGTGLILLKNKDEKTLAYALARQWWGQAVGNDQINDSWQGVGLSAYSALEFFDSEPSYGVSLKETVQLCRKNYQGYFQRYAALTGKADGRMTKPLFEYLNGYEYRVVNADKAVVMFDFLKEGIGEKRFLSGLKRYFKEGKYSFVSSGVLIGCFEKSGADVAGFFDGFLSGNAIL